MNEMLEALSRRRLQDLSNHVGMHEMMSSGVMPGDHGGAKVAHQDLPKDATNEPTMHRDENESPPGKPGETPAMDIAGMLSTGGGALRAKAMSQYKK